MKLLILFLSIFIYTSALGCNSLKARYSVEEIDSSYYNEGKVLESFCQVLYELKAHYKFTEKLIYYGVKTNRPLGFFICDLTDTLNNSLDELIKFKEGHIYYFAPRDLYYSYSNFCFLQEGKLIFFKAVNCKMPINNINEVVEFYKKNMPNSPESAEIIKRIIAYKDYAKFKRNDLDICKCEF